MIYYIRYANVTSPGCWPLELTLSLIEVHLGRIDTVEFTFLPFTACMFKFDQCKIFLAMINITILISLLVVLLGIWQNSFKDNIDYSCDREHCTRNGISIIVPFWPMKKTILIILTMQNYDPYSFIVGKFVSLKFKF